MTPVIGLELTLTPKLTHLNCIYLITSEKTKFPNKITFTGPEGQDLGVSFLETEFKLLKVCPFVPQPEVVFSFP